MTFNAWNDNGPAGYVGLVKNRASTACVDPADDDQKLGTGGPGIAIGQSSQGIHITFIPQLSQGATIEFEFQTLDSATLGITMFSDDGSELAVETILARPAGGTCGFPGPERARSTALFTTIGEVRTLLIDSRWVLVIDDLRITPPQPGPSRDDGGGWR